MNDKINLEVYGEEEKSSVFNKIKTGVKNLWNSTIFPEMIKTKKEEKQFKKEIMKEAKQEAMIEMKDKLKEEYKKKELDKMTGKGKGNFIEKLAKGFEKNPTTKNNKFVEMIGTKSNGNKIAELMGGTKSEKIGVSKMLGGNKMVDSDKISRMIGMGEKHKKEKKKIGLTKKINVEEKIKRMLG